MPYIITTHRHLDDPTAEFLPGAKPGVSRRAVATLDEARRAALEIIRPFGLSLPADASCYDAARTLAESGGSIGPLSDGTVIEVASVPWSGTDGMYALAGWDGTGSFDGEPIADYNAAQ